MINVKIGDIIVATSLKTSNHVIIFYILEANSNDVGRIQTWKSINNSKFAFELSCLKNNCTLWHYELIQC